MNVFSFLVHKEIKNSIFVRHISTTNPESANPDFYADLKGQILPTLTPPFFSPSGTPDFSKHS